MTTRDKVATLPSIGTTSMLETVFERPMLALATTSTADAVLPLRVRCRQEMNCQIVHDSIHRRDGWKVTYIFNVDGVTAGFGSIALAGPAHCKQRALYGDPVERRPVGGNVAYVRPRLTSRGRNLPSRNLPLGIPLSLCRITLALD